MRRLVLLLTCAMALAAAPAVAEEIIYFTNGTQMAIRGYAVEDEMVHVDLGDNAFMAFPFSQVERIEKAGKDVFLSPSNSSTNKQIKVAPVKGAAPVRGHRASTREAWERSRTHGAANESHRIEQDPDTGLASYRPYSYSGQRGKRQLRSVGNQAVLGGRRAQSSDEGIVGTRPVGGNHQLPGVNVPDMYREDKQVTSIEFRGGASTPPPADDAGEGGESAGGAGGDEGGGS